MTEAEPGSTRDEHAADGAGPAHGGERHVARIARASDEESLRALYAFRYQVFVEERGWMPRDRPEIPGHVRFENGVSLLTDIFDEGATNFAAYDDLGDVVGSVRIVPDSPRRLPVERSLPLDFYRPGRVLAEVGRFAAAPDYRRSSLAARLMRIAIQFSVLTGITHILVDTLVSEAGPETMYGHLGFETIAGPFQDLVHTCDGPGYVLALDLLKARDDPSVRPSMYRFFSDVQPETLEAVRSVMESA